MNGRMTPATLAGCFELALRFRTIERAAVVSWADDQIADNDRPDLWLIELSTAKEQEIESRLRDCLGSRDEAEALNQFLGHVTRLWNTDNLSIGELRGIAWSLHCDDLLPTHDGEADWGCVLEVEGEGLDEGWISESRFRKYASESLEQYQGFTEFADLLATLENARREQGAATNPGTA